MNNKKTLDEWLSWQEQLMEETIETPEEKETTETEPKQ